MSCCFACRICREVGEVSDRSDSSSECEDDDDKDDYLTANSDEQQEFDSLYFPPNRQRAMSGESTSSLAEVLQSLRSFITCSAELPSADLTMLADFSADWWSSADLPAARCCAGLSAASELVAARTVRDSTKGVPPWSPTAAGRFYEDTGAVGRGNQYVAVWIHLGDSALVFLSKATQGQALDACMASSDALMHRLKLLINPVEVKLPFPCKAARDAETVGAFFGQSAAWTDVTTTPSGAEVYAVRVDLFSKWLLKFAMQKVGFQLGNCVEMILVDWPGTAVLGAVRLQVTSSFLEVTT
mmetsp:Transcript_80856/g.142623  ORF Transcript_80856/g.142623 Transcript_80856/m.142623 type:complete len:299 (-) Transcript_80856:80-976(-)